MTRDRHLLRRKEAARMLGGDAEINRLVSAGDLRTYQLSTGERRFLWSDVVEIQYARFDSRPETQTRHMTNAERRRLAEQQDILSRGVNT